MITIHIYYTGANGSARKFIQEMIASGIVNDIRKEKGNLRYDYYFPIDDEETVLLIDSWADQDALDKHHELPLMKKIAALREKYDLHMKVEKFVGIEDRKDEQYIRK